MAKLKLFSDRKSIKCANIVGQTLALHPHADSSVYGALVRLAQAHLVRVPLVAGEGNFGSEEEEAAASRYTNARLSPLGEALVSNLNKSIVPYIDSYDGEGEEPVYLNAPFPTLLATSTLGIGMGMAVSLPSFPISEIIDSTIAYLRNPNLSIEELVEVLRPDFPSGCTIVNSIDLPKIYSTGSGSLLLRATFQIHGNTLIVNNFPIYSLASKVEQQIREAKLNGELKDIIKVVNTTSEKSQLTIQFKNNVNQSQLIRDLCRLTDLERSFTFNFKALDVDGKPKHYTLPTFFSEWIAQHKALVRKELELELFEAEQKLEIVEGLLKALISIEEIIELIKSSQNRKQAEESLQLKGFSKRQANAILEIKLARLTKLQAVELNEQKEKLVKEIEDNQSILQNKTLFLQFIIEKMERHKKLDIPRATKIENSKFPKEENVKNTTFYISLGKNTATVLESIPRGKFEVSTAAQPLHLLYNNFTLPIKKSYENPFQDVWGILKKDCTIYHISENGYIKGTEGRELITSRKAKIMNQDKIIGVFQTPKNEDSKILINTTSGEEVEIDLQSISITKRGAKGNKIKIGNERIKDFRIVKGNI